MHRFTTICCARPISSLRRPCHIRILPLAPFFRQARCLRVVASPDPTKEPSTLPPRRPFSKLFFLFDWHFWRIFCATVFAIYLPCRYIGSTTIDQHGIDGVSMYPLLRPSSEELLNTNPSNLPRKAPSQAALIAQPHSKDHVLIIPTSSNYPRLNTLLAFLAFCKILPPSPLHNDPFNYNIRLYDDPISEGGSGAKSNLERGMVVCFLPPYKDGAGYVPGRVSIKRIVGLEGDIVVPQGAVDGRIGYDQALGRERMLRLWQEGGEMDDICSGRWVEAGMETRNGDIVHMAGVKVPYGHVWLEGANQLCTFDSNDYGVLSKSLIQGVAVGVLKPRRREFDWRKSWRNDCGKRVFRVKDGRGILVRREEKIEDELAEEWAM